MDVVRAHFRPEFLNRLDEIILFHRLGAGPHGADRRHPGRRGSALLKDRKIVLALTDAAQALAGPRRL